MKYKLVRFGDHFELRKGFSYSGENLADSSNIGFVTLNSFLPGGGYKYGSEKPLKGEIPEKFILNDGDVCLAMVEQDEGLLASGLLVDYSTNPYNTLVYSHHVAKLFPLSKDLEAEFVYNTLRIPAIRRRAAYGDAGSTVQDLPYSAMYEQELPCPPIEIQRATNRIISDIDSKIFINKRAAETLEEIAQTIFKSWFVDFDPVHAKSRGEQPEGMDAETAALFPDSFEDSEHGPIPSGWSIGVIRDLCSVVTNGSTPLRSNSDFWESGSVDWFKTGELADGYLLDSGERISMEAVKSTSVKTLPAGSVLMAIYAAPTVGRLGILTREATFNQACTGMVPRAEFSTAMVYLWLKTRRDWFNSLATGTGQQNISKTIVEECPITIPSADVVKKFKLLTSSIFEQMEVLAKQNKALAEIRDSLLPGLISGELGIPEELLGE